MEHKEGVGSVGNEQEEEELGLSRREGEVVEEG